ncbi:MAG: glycosyltransferase [Microbacteriaceae bacterium]
MTDLSTLNITVASRIYLPEPAAASFRLGALARGLRDAGASTTVLTTNPPLAYDEPLADHDGVTVRRARVLRDSAGYVRGYAQYMSFDIPLFFRLLFRRRPDVIVVEPPPTTGFFVRIASAIMRVPYVYYAADIWSDAVQTTDAPTAIAKIVRSVELWAMRGAAAVMSASTEFTERLAELGVDRNVTTIGNGVDTALFSSDGPARDLGAPYLLYAGTASEVHGATIFLDAFARVLQTAPDSKLVFVGQGSEREQLERRAAQLPAGSVHFEARLAPLAVAEWIRGASATLASVRPEGYHRAFPTKMYASVACGTPVIYAGVGPGRDFAREPDVGTAVDYEIQAVAAAMSDALTMPADAARRARIAAWAVATVSLAAVAERAVAVISGVASTRQARRD